MATTSRNWNWKTHYYDAFRNGDKPNGNAAVIIGNWRHDHEFVTIAVGSLDKMSSQMLYRYILILSEGIPEDEAAYSIGYRKVKVKVKLGYITVRSKA